MWHPLFSAALRHPDLLADHAANYGALVRDELAIATHGVVSRVIAGAVAAVSALTALCLTGTAIMLGVLHGQFSWVLAVVPGVAVAVAVIGAWIAFRPASFHSFDELGAQFQADVRALRALQEGGHG
ncbi:MAG: hypothetical protein JSR41_06930 [Proteobacteria bacterium]|nr:hypothetical protein [Pseudomonadota bacterium]